MNSRMPFSVNLRFSVSGMMLDYVLCTHLSKKNHFFLVYSQCLRVSSERHQKQRCLRPVGLKTLRKQTSSSSSMPQCPRSRGNGNSAPTHGRPRVAKSFGCTTDTGPSATARWALAAWAPRRRVSRSRLGVAIARRSERLRKLWSP